MKIFNNDIKDNETHLPDTPEFRRFSNKLYDRFKTDNDIKKNREEYNKNVDKMYEKQNLRITRDRKSSILFRSLKINPFDSELKTRHKNVVRKREKTIKFGYFFGICDKFCKVKNNSHLYDFLKRYINERMDVTFYLKTLEKFDRVRVLLFNYYQNLCLDFTKIPNLSNQDELTNYDMDIQDKKISHEEIVEYFNYRIKNREMDECDQQLLNIVTPEIKNLVISSE